MKSRFSTALLLSCLLAFSCSEGPPPPVAQEAPPSPEPSRSAQDMACGIWPPIPAVEACTLVSLGDSLPLWPEALSLSPSRPPRLVWPDGSTRAFPHELEVSDACEIPIQRAREGLPAVPSAGRAGPVWQTTGSPLRAGNHFLTIARPVSSGDGVASGPAFGQNLPYLLVFDAEDGTVLSFWPLPLPLDSLIALSPQKRELYALTADQRIACFSLAAGARPLQILPDPGALLPAPLPDFDAWSPPGCDRDPAVGDSLTPCVPEPDTRSGGTRNWALVPPADALDAMRTKTRELLRPEGDFEFLDVSFQTPWTRLPPRGALLVRMAGEEQRSVRIRLESDEAYLMILFDDKGQRLADNMGYEAEKTLSRTLPAGRVHWLALAFLHPAREPARLVVQETGGGKAKEQGEVF